MKERKKKYNQAFHQCVNLTKSAEMHNGVGDSSLSVPNVSFICILQFCFHTNILALNKKRIFLCLKCFFVPMFKETPHDNENKQEI